MVKPNSFRLPDDEIVRLYKENRLGDWAKMIPSIARVAGATEQQLVSILNRRSDDLGMCPTPHWTGHTFVLVMPKPSVKSINDILLRRIQMARTHANAAIDEMKNLVKILNGIEAGIKENASAGEKNGG